MNLLSGEELDREKFFRGGRPSPQASSFDLSIGRIYDDKGAEVCSPFTLDPGHMVQVVSAEIFNLPSTITGHVTYKTSLTKEGIWALTVGIVDPGWDGPIATTLLNFSSVKHTIHRGDKFLRVSLFQHPPVDERRLRKSPPLSEYYKHIQSLAASRFPTTFLNSEEIAANAGKKVLARIRLEGLAWVALVAILFTAIQVLSPPIADMFRGAISDNDVRVLVQKIEKLESKVESLEAERQE
ncbi:hypothetical protein L0F51_09560 [Afifella sp. H1R]|uniref:dCTP deaminase domain-containing protein n=1 Tax=Afifella sp. H1R TaxID=2908841 RepID=UPI001F402834|nr:hypothetical protein [Afifella sp. H1R]MCF1504009.1 hypothetical protein [Afifella sp. H1R]